VNASGNHSDPASVVQNLDSRIEKLLIMLPDDLSSRGIGTPVAIVLMIVIGIIAAFSLGFSFSTAGHQDAFVETDGSKQ
jgi:hypothetical protein